MTSKKYWKYRFILYLLHIDCWIPTLLFFHEYCISSSLYQVDIFRATFVPALALSPSWVPILITPSFFVIIAGSLSPISQHWPSVVVKRKSSAHPASPMKLSSSKEWMHKSKETLKAGPQVGSVASRLSCPTGTPTKIICHAWRFSAKGQATTFLIPIDSEDIKGPKVKVGGGRVTAIHLRWPCWLRTWSYWRISRSWRRTVGH